MQLLIDGQAHELIDIKAFRAEQGLPAGFGVALFEPKDYAGLGRIDRAGAELNAVRQAVLDAIPPALSLDTWSALQPQLGGLFLAKLREINDVVGLKEVEIEYAYAGFEDVCPALLYALLQARAGSGELPPFERIYGDWLNSAVRVSRQAHPYTHRGATWQVQVVNNVYGRVGLVVRTPSETFYVRDAGLACPAEGFMASLLRDVAERIIQATAW